MIIRRILSILFDVLSALFPAYGLYLSGFGLAISFLVLYIIEQLVGVIYYKGITMGAHLFKVAPKNYDGSKIRLFKSILYSITMAIIVGNILNPYIQSFSKIILPIIMILPFYDTKHYNSVTDIIFRIHWIKIST
jgi:uncharacterized RDD family membrane protein YckC